jgi:hypothetical protein
MTTTTWQDVFNPRRELLTLSCAAMELCWAYGFFAVGLAMGGEQRVGVFVFAALVAVALYSSRFLLNSRLRLQQQQTLSIALALLSILMMLRLTIFSHLTPFDLSWLLSVVAAIARLFLKFSSEMLVILMGVFAWWRGVSMAQASLDFDSIGFRFRLGVLLLALLALINTWVGRITLVPYLFGFFFFGLMSVALARQEDVGRGDAHRSLPLKGPWLAILVGSAALVLGLGIVLGLALTPQGLLAFLSLFKPLEPLVIVILYVLLTLVALLVQLIYAIATWVITAFRGSGANQLIPNLQLPPPPAISPQEMQAFTLPEPVQMGCAVMLFVGLLLLLAWSLNQAQRRRRGDDNVTRESVPVSIGWDPFKKLRELFRRKPVIMLDESIATIRRIYANLARLAAQRGFPRGEAETPYEFMRDLRAAFPTTEADERAITEAYVRVHYGEQEPSADDVAQVREAWERIKQVKDEG